MDNVSLPLRIGGTSCSISGAIAVACRHLGSGQAHTSHQGSRQAQTSHQGSGQAHTSLVWRRALVTRSGGACWASCSNECKHVIGSSDADSVCSHHGASRLKQQKCMTALHLISPILHSENFGLLTHHSIFRGGQNNDTSHLDPSTPLDSVKKKETSGSGIGREQSSHLSYVAMDCQLCWMADEKPRGVAMC